MGTQIFVLLFWAFLLLCPTLAAASSTHEATYAYAYDALDRRTAKTVDGVTEAYVYDSADLGDRTSANPALTFRAGVLVKRWLFGPQVDEGGRPNCRQHGQGQNVRRQPIGNIDPENRPTPHSYRNAPSTSRLG